VVQAIWKHLKGILLLPSSVTGWMGVRYMEQCTWLFSAIFGLYLLRKGCWFSWAVSAWYVIHMHPILQVLNRCCNVQMTFNYMEKAPNSKYMQMYGFSSAIVRRWLFVLCACFLMMPWRLFICMILSKDSPNQEDNTRVFLLDSNFRETTRHLFMFLHSCASGTEFCRIHGIQWCFLGMHAYIWTLSCLHSTLVACQMSTTTMVCKFQLVPSWSQLFWLKTCTIGLLFCNVVTILVLCVDMYALVEQKQQQKQ
jgi:hypothetical protein